MNIKSLPFNLKKKRGLKVPQLHPRKDEQDQVDQKEKRAWFFAGSQRRVAAWCQENLKGVSVKTAA